MKTRIWLNGEFKEIETKVRQSWSNEGFVYQIVGYEAIMRDSKLDGERIFTLEQYDTREEAEKALKWWQELNKKLEKRKEYKL